MAIATALFLRFIGVSLDVFLPVAVFLPVLVFVSMRSISGGAEDVLSLLLLALVLLGFLLGAALIRSV